MTVQETSLFTTYALKSKTLKNRFAVAPMTRVSANEDGSANQRMAHYYERFAAGGFGLVITEGMYTDNLFSQGYKYQPGLSNDAQAKSWQQIVNSVHSHAGIIFAQLMHAGALSQHNSYKNHTVAPSSVQPIGQQMAFYYGDGPYPTPHELTEDEISTIIDGFVASAVRAVNIAGFDGIEIHGANGYLLDQFMTEHTNLRHDKWGGSIQNRIALTFEVCKRVRSAVNENIPVGVRISQGKVNDYEHKWAGGEQDAEIIFGTLAQAGVDFIHITEYEAWKPAFPDNELSLIALAKRYAPGVTIIGNGTLHDVDKAELAMHDGADIIALGKAALSNADLPIKRQKGQAIKPINTDMLSPIANLKDYELTL